MTDADASAAVAIPRWFVWVASIISSGFVVMFVPWATWVTATLITISVQSQMAGRADVKIDAISQKLQEHIGDPNLHGSAIKDFERRFQRVDERLELLEGRK